jgi:biotin carboxylase
MTVEQTVPFRDKEAMKRVLDGAGIRTPRHGSAATAQQVREHAERIGYPLIVKPIAGAGSRDTYKVESAQELARVIGLVRHVPEVSVEEFVDGEDYTFDTVCVDGEAKYFNIAFYRPRALVSREHHWISQQTICRRDVDSRHVAQGRTMGFAVLKALGFGTGFTHMEWYRRPDGEAVFGEIAARAPGVRTVDLMNYACDIDLFAGWAEAACHGRFSQPVQRKYFSAGVFKRANGEGTVRRIEGLERILAELGHHVCAVDLTPVGQPRRDWRSSVIGDGFVMLRHPDLETTLEMADRVATEVQLYAA